MLERLTQPDVWLGPQVAVERRGKLQLVVADPAAREAYSGSG